MFKKEIKSDRLCRRDAQCLFCNKIKLTGLFVIFFWIEHDTVVHKVLGMMHNLLFMCRSHVTPYWPRRKHLEEAKENMPLLARFLGDIRLLE